jgi:outer membrane autotransporter protein
MRRTSHATTKSGLEHVLNRVNARVKLELLKTVSVAALSVFVAPTAFAQTVVSTNQTLAPGAYAGILVNSGATVTGSGIDSETSGAGKYALEVTGSSDASFTNGDFTTNGTNDPNTGAHAYVVYAHDGSTVTLTGGTVTSASTSGQNATFPDTRDYALFTDGEGSSITATGTEITTSGYRSYGAYAINGSTITLSDVSVTTNGALGYGLYSRNAGSEISATDFTIETNGFTGNAVWAFDGGHVVLDGGSITVNGNDNPNDPHEASVGILASGGGYLGDGTAGVVDATDVTIVSHGINSFGLQAGGAVGDEDTYGTINFTGGSVVMDGEGSTAALVESGSTLHVTDSALTSVGTAVDVSGEGTTATLTDTDVTTTGDDNDYGVSATDGGVVTIIGGSVTTLSDLGQDDVLEGAARGYALFAADGGSISADGTTILTNGQRSYGAHAMAGGSIELNDVSITTNGALGYGLYARDGGEISATDFTIVTNGFTGNGVWAFNGGHVTLDGGTITVNGSDNPNEPHEASVGILASGAGYLGSETEGVVDATDVTVVVHGDRSFGLQAGGSVGEDDTHGAINFTGGSVTTTGADAIGAIVETGSTLNLTDTTLAATGVNNVGIQILDNATVSLTGTTVTATAASIVSNIESAGVVQTIDVNEGSDLTVNDGTLLVVNRTEEGADGQVNFNLNADAVASGDILDEDDKSETGFTDVFVSTDATYSGVVRGVRNFTSEAGSDITFEGEAQIDGDLIGDGTNFKFSQLGGHIAGDVLLTNGSSTTGGSIAAPVFVAGDVDVDETSVFGGNWNVAGNVVNDGTLNPGNSIGVIVVGGNYTFGPASTYLVEVNGAGQSDLLQVGGVAALDGVVTVGSLGGVALNTTYTIVTAGSISGTFDGATFAASSPYPFLTPTLGYTATTATLRLLRSNLTFASVGVTPNQIGVGGALDSLGLTTALVQALAVGSTGNALAAFDQLTGEAYASAKTGLFEDSRYIRNAMLARVADPKAEGVTLWGDAYGSWGQNDATSGTAEISRESRGLFVGVDTTLDGTTRVGVVAGYSQSDYDVDALRSSGEARTFQVGAYAGRTFDRFTFSAGAAYAWHNIDMDRSVAFTGFTDALSSSYDASTGQAFADVGYAMPVSGGDVGPFANLAYVRVHTDGVTEKGGSAALSIDDDSSDVTFSTIGLRAKFGAAPGQEGLGYHGSLGWRHAFNDTAPGVRANFAGSTAFTAQGTPIGENAAVIDLGLDVTSSKLSAGLGYSGQFGDGASDNAFKAHVRIAF